MLTDVPRHPFAPIGPRTVTRAELDAARAKVARADAADARVAAHEWDRRHR